MTKSNHIYIGNEDIAQKWIGEKPHSLPNEKNGKDAVRDTDTSELEKVIVPKVRELIKNYLQLDNVSFLFGTGSSIHLGAVSIQSIPEDVRKAAFNCDKKLMVSSLMALQNSLVAELKEVHGEEKLDAGKLYNDKKGWKYVKDEDGLIHYCTTKECNENEIETTDEIASQLEKLLDYLIAQSYVASATGNDNKMYDNLIEHIKKAMFMLCDVHNREPSEKDKKRIADKGYEQLFKEDKYIFHEKFIKSLLQRPLNLKRANIFTCNYDLAFEYAFDKLGVQYIDGFSGFHHRTFKPETFEYDVFYPGSTTAGKVQRIEKVLRYFKLHGSISWI